jgi:hypothetical protein
MRPQELIDIHEAERVTGLDKSTLYKLSREGRVRSFKVLNALRFERADLLALITERPASSVPASPVTEKPTSAHTVGGRRSRG